MGKDVPRVVSQGQQSHVDRRKHAAFIQQHLCQTGFGITETFRRITEACARRDKKGNLVGQQPLLLLPLSQVAQPLGSQKALQRLDRGLNKAFLASKCPLTPTHRFHAGDGENKERFKRKSEGEKKICPVV